jgi:formamidopyrimidine-DNA glycosylase
MPELPEVENTRRFLVPVLEGSVIRDAEVRRQRMARRNLRPDDVPERLRGRRLERLGRHGKFLLGELERDLTLVVHLGMSGRLRVARAGEPEDPHTNVVLHVDGDTEVRFVDPRTFGFVAVLTPDERADSSLSALGPDALLDPPRPETLGARFAGRAAAVKALLLDQRILSGLGNIYADEVLHRARVNPTRPGGSLSPAELRALCEAIPAVLEDGIRHGGTSLDDLAYLLPDGRAGEYLGRLAAYGRTGLACPRCGTPIVRAVVAQRSTHWCPVCQPSAIGMGGAA